MHSYSRQNPSPRYRELNALYRQMHEEGERFLDIPAEEVFAGTSLPPHLAQIKKLIERHGAKSLLDYGSGKGKQYEKKLTLPNGSLAFAKDYWELDSLVCYDPAYQPHSKLPVGQFDAVISTDVLEHCPEEDIPWILDEMFRYARKLVFLNVACFPAFKRLPNGENAHCTVKDQVWWTRTIQSVSDRYPAVAWHGIFDKGDQETSESPSTGENLSLWTRIVRCCRERRLPDRLKRKNYRRQPAPDA